MLCRCIFLRPLTRAFCSKKFGTPSVFPTVCLDPETPSPSHSLGRAELSDDLLLHLEELSLVRFSGPSAVHHLQKAIEYANQLRYIDTENIEPMYTVLEDEYLRLREDRVTEGNCREQILSNASKLVEEYFWAPPGNIPLEPENGGVKRELLNPKEIKELAKHRRRGD